MKFFKVTEVDPNSRKRKEILLRQSSVIAIEKIEFQYREPLIVTRITLGKDWTIDVLEDIEHVFMMAISGEEA